MNPRPSDYKSDALPTELRQRFDTKLERETGLEPATNGLEGRDSTIELLPRIQPLYSRESWPRGQFSAVILQRGIRAHGGSLANIAVAEL